MLKLDSYKGFAYLYDRLMNDVDYDRWLQFSEKAWGENKPVTVVDLGCGTGTLTKMFAENGYEVTGIDISSDMLAVAEQKTRGQRVRYLCQDMREFSLSDPVDAVVSFCDSINYLLEEDDIQRTFAAVYAQLNNGGIFLFDVHTPHKVLEIFGQESFHLVEDDISYIWLCETDEKKMRVQHDLTIFYHAQSGCYRRFDEIHHQRAYKIDLLIEWLRQAGFDRVWVTAAYGNEELQPESDRAFFAAFKG